MVGNFSLFESQQNDALCPKTFWALQILFWGKSGQILFCSDCLSPLPRGEQKKQPYNQVSNGLVEIFFNNHRTPLPIRKPSPWKNSLRTSFHLDRSTSVEVYKLIHKYNHLFIYINIYTFIPFKFYLKINLLIVKLIQLFYTKRKKMNT